MLVNLNQPSRQILLELLNRTNRLAFTSGDVTFGSPQSVPGDGYDTEVEVTGNGTTRFVGPETLQYRRLDLAVLLNGDLTWTDAQAAQYSTVGHMLHLVNERYGLNLTTDDVEDAEFSWETPDMTSVTLTALPTSLAFQGTATVTLQIPDAPEGNDIVFQQPYAATEADSGNLQFGTPQGS